MYDSLVGKVAGYDLNDTSSNSDRARIFLSPQRLLIFLSIGF
jgi:hypothetical protein